MDTPILVAFIAGGVSLASAALTVLEKARTARITSTLQVELSRQSEAFKAELAARQRAEELSAERERVVSRFREPLARSAYDLQSRIWNILNEGFLGAFLENGNERERAYAVNNTLYLIAQYFAWVEIIRREINFVDLGEDEGTRKLSHLQDLITKLWGSDSVSFGVSLRIWAGEQRALGDTLVREGPRGTFVIGYGAFVDEIDPGLPPLLEDVAKDLKILAGTLGAGRCRLVLLQHALIDLLDHLDPKALRFPSEYRKKVEEK
jgi:hypothetical protein